MPNETLARRYASAVFQLAQEAGKIAPVQHDLHTFVAALAADEDVRKFFRSPVVDRKEKETIVGQAFSRLDPIALHTILLLVRKRREAHGRGDRRAVSTSSSARRAAPSRSRSPARASCSRGELDAIVARWRPPTATSSTSRKSVDPSLIGGVRITMGDKRADGTVAGRLDDIARSAVHELTRSPESKP